MTGLITANRMLIVDLTQREQGTTLVSGDYDLGGLMHRLERHVRQIAARASFSTRLLHS